MWVTLLDFRLNEKSQEAQRAEQEKLWAESAEAENACLRAWLIAAGIEV